MLENGVIPIPPARNTAGLAEFLCSVKEPIAESIFTTVEAATSVDWVTFRELAMTLKPRSTNPLTIPAPIPCEAPVTMAVFRGPLMLVYLERSGDYFKRARYALILRALVPTSLLPTRETDRTSIREPAGEFVSRTTTSSLKPNQAVVSVASIRSDLGSAATISHPMSFAACNARGKAASGEMP